MAASGALTGWLKEISGDLPFAELTEEAAKVTPGSDTLVVLPYFDGERMPLFDPKARGPISGPTLSHGRGRLYWAVLEATAYGVRHIFEFMREAGRVGERLVAVGGGTKGGLWTEIVSDVTGRPQDLPEQTIGARATGTPCWPHVRSASRSQIRIGARSPIPSSPGRKITGSTTNSIVSTGISIRPPARRPTLWPACKKEKMSLPERRPPETKPPCDRRSLLPLGPRPVGSHLAPQAGRPSFAPVSLSRNFSLLSEHRKPRNRVRCAR